MYVCIYSHIYIYTYARAHSERERERERERDREGERERERARNASIYQHYAAVSFRYVIPLLQEEYGSMLLVIMQAPTVPDRPPAQYLQGRHS